MDDDKNKMYVYPSRWETVVKMVKKFMYGDIIFMMALVAILTVVIAMMVWNNHINVVKFCDNYKIYYEDKY